MSVPEVREYDQINKEIVRLLSEGMGRIILAGVEGQRLLAASLAGPWRATIEVEGRAGPELAARIDAPNLIVIARSDADDAAGAGMYSGRLVIEGNAGDGLGYGQRGGTIIVAGDAGDRAGLMQSGGSILVLGKSGRLAAERQSGGVFAARRARTGPYPGRARRGGRLVWIGDIPDLSEDEIATLGLATD